jgi:hypothetical protein
MLNILLLNATRYAVVYKKSENESGVGSAEIHVAVGGGRAKAVLAGVVKMNVLW